LKQAAAGMHLPAVLGRRRIAREPDGGARRREGVNTTFDEPSERGLARVTDVQAVAAVAPRYPRRRQSIRTVRVGWRV
jgi:hypothetical protein